ncbi:MAG: hypothetical protein Greene071421_390 [Parcubacteria group bacterium Greene0714_21]|nr:MAG: hypothetical protein Greene041639_43 [Parcubacteria group bacterium Greene0416_39]TSC98373.1 MAG: hypothetical protein Greene101447_116 [Parcubacteria group bacterium Greene1014_47]TSD04024.1 MAG: hypothetical protein Greene071421_390 [Parcubacteria group bacterium Greene0714_21]
MTDLKKVFCKNCKKPIYRSVGRFNENLKFGWNFYCSRKCEYQYKTQRKILACEYCNEKFARALSAISPHNYCSSSCAAKQSNFIAPRYRVKPKVCAYEECRKRFRGENKYCSRQCGKSGRKGYTPEQLIKLLKQTASEMQRTPAKRDVRTLAERCITTFGSWNKAIQTAGFIPNRSHDNRMYKRVNAKAIDGHVCDSISELLIDNWLDKNNILHERDAYYPTTHHKADWKIFAKNKELFVEYFGLANDSPRYDRSIREKEMLCKKYNIHLIGIYPKDIYPKNYLESSLKNKFRDFLH